eukprot:scaffold4054_cov157-Ochromonas_danica.AAC.7
MVLRYRYRPAPVQPELADGKVGASLSLAKQQKPSENDPYEQFLASAWEEPAFLPEQTQKQRVESQIYTNEEVLRRKQYPTIEERIIAQKRWARQQLQEAKIATQKAALDRSIQQTLAQAQHSTMTDFARFEKELNDLMQESEDDLMLHHSKDDDEQHQQHQSKSMLIQRQLLDLKEKKVLATRTNTAKYHPYYSKWQRRKKAIAYKLGWLKRQDGPATLVLPWLLLGNRDLATNESQLIALNITHVLNMTHDCPHAFPQSFVYERVAIRDSLE